MKHVFWLHFQSSLRDANVLFAFVPQRQVAGLISNAPTGQIEMLGVCRRNADRQDMPGDADWHQ